MIHSRFSTNMSEVQYPRDMLKRRLTPHDDGMITDQEEDMCHLKEEDKRDMQPLLVSKEETKHQEWNLSVDQQDIKKEQKLWVRQQGERLREADATKFGFTAVLVKSENDEKPEASQLHLSQSEEMTEAEPVASSSSVHRTLTAQDDGEEDGGPQAASNSGPNSQLQQHTSGRSSDSSGTETDDIYDWKEIRKLQSSLNCQRNTNVLSSSTITEKQFHCSKYGKASGHMNNSEQHKLRQASVKPLSLSDQSKRQKEMDTLNKHVINQTGQKPFGCSECGRRFGRKSHLIRHMIIHTEQNTVGCSECGQRFRRKSHLNKHMTIHTGQKLFGCSECSRRFGQKNHLNEHMRIHTGQKQFGCSECDQRFRQKGDLNRHMIIHTGQKQFGCSECGQRFGLKSNLNRHMIVHTGQRPFGCSECGQRFGRNSHLNRHMILHTTPTTALGSHFSSDSTQLVNPPDHQFTDPGPQQ